MYDLTKFFPAIKKTLLSPQHAYFGRSTLNERQQERKEKNIVYSV